MRHQLYVLLLGIVLSTACTATPETAPVAKQIYEGSGRGCAGKLVITAKNLSWNTSFSQCASVAYEVVKADETTQVFHLKQKPKKCLSEYIQLDRKKENDQAEVIGYQNQQDFAQKNTENALVCMVIKQ